MMMWIIALIYTYFMLKVYAYDPVTWNNDEIVNIEHAEEVLAEIQPEEALPLVLCLLNKGTEGKQLESPDSIVKAVLVNGKMVSGTEFHLTDSEKQILLCPKQNSQERCLAPQNFEDHHRLQCAEQPTPDVREDNMPNTCGIQNTGITYAVIYDICPAEDSYQYMSRGLTIYLFCYDGQNNKTLFTTHSLLHHKLLDSKLLYREQQLKYPWFSHPRFETANYEEIQNSLYLELHPLLFLPRKPQYRIQTLVPSEDMPLGIWKKTINQSINFKLQHNIVFDFWNLLNQRVREAFTTIYADSGYEFLIRTGVFYNEAGVEDDYEHIYNRWVKMIIARKDDKELLGIVIIMDNFLVHEFKKPRKQLLNEDMEKYGTYDLCHKNFRGQVRGANGQVKCYRVNPVIRRLFGLDGENVPPLLNIPQVTFPLFYDKVENQT